MHSIVGFVRNLTMSNVSYSIIHSSISGAADNAVSKLQSPSRKGEIPRHIPCSISNCYNKGNKRGKRGRRTTTKEGRLKDKHSHTLAARYRQIETYLSALSPSNGGGKDVGRMFNDSKVSSFSSSVSFLFEQPNYKTISNNEFKRMM